MKIQVTKKPERKLPKRLEHPDFSKLKETVLEFMEYRCSKDYHEDHDFKQWIYEAAVEAVYGKDVWEKIN